MSTTPEHLVPRIFAAIDDHRFDELPAFYTETVQARTIAGPIAGRDRLVHMLREFHQPFTALQHLVTGVIVDEDGSNAQVRANVIALFGTDDRQLAFEGGSVWRGHLLRSGNDWQVAQFSLDLVWSRGAWPSRP